MSKYKTEEKLITHTGGHKKALINLDIAEKVLDQNLMNQLNYILIELNDVQETKLDKN